MTTSAASTLTRSHIKVFKLEPVTILDMQQVEGTVTIHKDGTGIFEALTRRTGTSGDALQMSVNCFLETVDSDGNTQDLSCGKWLGPQLRGATQVKWQIDFTYPKALFANVYNVAEAAGYVSKQPTLPDRDVIGFWVVNMSAYTKTYFFLDEGIVPMPTEPGAIYPNMEPHKLYSLLLAKKNGGDGWMRYHSDVDKRWTETGWIKDNDIVSLY